MAFSRLTKTWNNTTMLWSDFLTRIEHTQRTGETVKQYRGLSKAQQDNIKDVGGFFGGCLVGGRRSNTTVQSRQLITLDIDDGVKDLWGLFIMLYGNAAALYTTHKHTPSKPRYRLMIPLSEEVSAEEYEAIARRIASNIGIDYFDDTSFQPARFMYWPSSSKDGEYIFEYQDGEWMDGKKLLTETYHNWKDRSEWPYSSRVPKVVKEVGKKQGDPTEKSGLVGLFCRAYDIYSAIDTFLADVYKPEGNDRYTYVKGTTSSGLVVYEQGKFAFSNHSTDPAGGHLCNAFDLVRLHLYGDRDDKDKTYSKPSDMPSFGLMEELCQKDKNVIGLRASEKVAEVSRDFGDADIPESEGNDLEDLLAYLDTDKKGLVLPTLKNYQAIIERDPRLKGKIEYDEFARQAFIRSTLPWRTPKNYYDSFWTNADDSNLRCYLNAEPYGLKASTQNVQDAFDAVMCRHTFHPIRQYLKGIKWDGVERLDTLYIDYFGALDTPLNRAMTRKAFTAAVARVFDPGCKWDYVLTVIGSEGLGKSSLLAKMGGLWFSDSFTSIDGTKGMEQLQRVWILELGELSVYKKAEVEPMKAFLTKRVDQFRPAYGRKTEIYPRQCVFFATTNENNFLKGDTGNRRFWPLNTGLQSVSKDLKDIDDAERDQLWAEAKYRYDHGEKLYLPKDLEAEARQSQNEHGEEDERQGIIEDFVDRRLPQGWEDKNRDERREYFQSFDAGISATGIFRRNRITAIEILNECFGERMDDSTRYHTRSISSILKRMKGWKYIGDQRNSTYGHQRTFERIEQENDNDLRVDDDKGKA
jgi:predicted P-loop ATPase